MAPKVREAFTVCSARYIAHLVLRCPTHLCCDALLQLSCSRAATSPCWPCSSSTCPMSVTTTYPSGPQWPSTPVSWGASSRARGHLQQQQVHGVVRGSVSS